MQEFSFKMVEDETFAAVGYRGDEEEVVIPAVYHGRPVTILFDSLFAGHAEILSVKIPETVTDIGEFVFDGCTNMTSVDLPENLEHIWPYAFARCGVEELHIPERVRSIAPFTFKDCKKLKKVTGGPELKEVYAYSFGGCTALSEFYFAPGTKVSPMAFETKDMKA